MPEDASIHDVVVVGGGVAGLVSAWELRDRDVVVFEEAEKVGGRVKSEQRDPYWLNFGAHLYPPAESVTTGILRSLGLESKPIQGKGYAIAWRGKIVPVTAPARYPFLLPLSSGGRASLIKAGLKLMKAERMELRERKNSTQLGPAEELQRQVAFMCDERFMDYIGKVHPDVHEMFSAVAGRVSAPLEGSAAPSAGCIVGHIMGANKGAQSFFFRSMPGGSGAYPQALARELGDRVRTGSAVTQVRRDGDLVEVEYTSGGEQLKTFARHVILATPAYVSARIAPDLEADTRAALESLPYGPYVVVSFLTKETRAMPWDDQHSILVVGKRFNLFSNQANILRVPGQPRQPGGSLMCYAGGDFARLHLDKSDEEVSQAFLDDACEIYPELRGIVEEAVVQRWHKGVPYIVPGRDKLQPALARPQERFSLAGDYFFYPAIEGASLSGISAALAARRTLATEATASAAA